MKKGPKYPFDQCNLGSQLSIYIFQVVLEDKKENKHKELPKFEKIFTLDDIKDGSYILAIFSYFHPVTVPWTDIDFSRGNKSAAFNNFNTIKTAAKKTLPYDIMHIQFIDLFNSEVDMKKNIQCFLLDMIVRLEFAAVRHQGDRYYFEKQILLVLSLVGIYMVWKVTKKYYFHDLSKSWHS